MDSLALKMQVPSSNYNYIIKILLNHLNRNFFYSGTCGFTLYYYLRTWSYKIYLLGHLDQITLGFINVLALEK